MRSAIGWALFHSLWQALIIAAALAASQIIVRSARARYVAGCIALLSILLSFVVTAICFLPLDGAEPRKLFGGNFTAWNGQPNLPNIPNSWSLLTALIPWLSPIWITGVTVFYLRYSIGCFSAFRMRQRGTAIAPEHWKQKLSSLQNHLRITRPVQLLESLLADTPMLIGHFRPVILVPIGFFSGLPANHVEAILLHELAHIARWDYLTNGFQRLLEGLFFYHPAVWWISNSVRTERENCCDDAVIRIQRDPHGYAAALTSLEQNRLEQPALAATGGHLMKRIKRMLYPQTTSSIWTPILATVILLSSSAAVVVGWHADQTPWQKWLNEDVVYIISDQEKVAFEELKTDEERTHFIEQFWDRRNPTPGAANNAFKEEHYRRIAYANNHWGKNVPGWKTDRGHMYIKYGPPDEIDSHPKGGKYKRPESEGGDTVIAYPFEDWLYHKIEGVGTNVIMEFVDVKNTGDFRMTLDPNIKVGKKVQ